MSECGISRDTLEYAQAQEFLAATEDFLYPISAEKVHCHLGQCSNEACFARPFRCRYTENVVVMQGMSPGDIERARGLCASNNTCHVEPIGGEGGLVETPIRDDPVAQHIHTATPLHNKTVNNLRYYRKVFCIVTIASLVVYIWKN